MYFYSILYWNQTFLFTEKKKNEYRLLGLIYLINKIGAPCGLELCLFYFFALWTVSLCFYAFSIICWVKTVMGLRNGFLFCGHSRECHWPSNPKSMSYHEELLKGYLVSTSVLVASSRSPRGVPTWIFNLCDNFGAYLSNTLVFERALSSLKQKNMYVYWF